MSDYDGMYLKLVGDPTYWAVDNGERLKVKSPEHMMQIGIRRVVTVEPGELDAIPLKGKRKRHRKPKAKPVLVKKEVPPKKEETDEDE